MATKTAYRVVEVRPLEPTISRSGKVLLPRCTCGNHASFMVIVEKFDHRFPEPKCDSCKNSLTNPLSSSN